MMFPVDLMFVCYSFSQLLNSKLSELNDLSHKSIYQIVHSLSETLNTVSLSKTLFDAVVFLKLSVTNFTGDCETDLF